MNTHQKLICCLIAAFSLGACSGGNPEQQETATTDTVQADVSPMQERLDIYVPVKLTTDLTKLSANEKQMIPLLIEAAKIMDGLFWREAYGDKEGLLNSIEDEAARKFVEINYGPWDRLNGDQPFLDGAGEKPAGANFYPKDMTKEEFEAAELEGKESLYTLLKRDESGQLVTQPYHEAFKAEVTAAAELLKKAAELAEDPGLQRYLTLRAEALLTDDYTNSDIAWLDMKTNGIDIIIGPIENYEDKLFGYKAAHEAYVLVKDKEWSERLKHYVAFLPELQSSLPVADAYKQESPGTDSELNAYDVVYYAGDCNAGSKTIAVNLPNDEELQKTKGTRRSQLKNAMRAKFDKILTPIANKLIAEEQRQYITFNAFFSNTMFHEVAHGLGIKNTINGKGTVRAALKEEASALEEGKADILGLYMITKLFEKGEISEGSLMDHYVTFLAGIFRSVRFGASSAHGRANMLRFNFFRDAGAFTRNETTGTYSVNFDKMQEAMQALSTMILNLQGDGNYEGVKQLMAAMGTIGEELQADLDLLGDAGIPVDIVFEQGVEVLGL